MSDTGYSTLSGRCGCAGCGASAHDEATFTAATLGIPPNLVTLVVLMGLGRSVAIACRLIDAGWSRGTPVAVITDATTAAQQVWRGTLDDLAEDRVVVDSRSAGTIVIGDVVSVGVGQTAVTSGWPAEAVAGVGGRPSPRAGLRGFGGRIPRG